MNQEPLLPYNILNGNLFVSFFKAGILILQQEPCDVKEHRNYFELPGLIKDFYEFALLEPGTIFSPHTSSTQLWVLMLFQTHLHRKTGQLCQLATTSLLAFVYRVNSQILSISTHTCIVTLWINRGREKKSVLFKKPESTVDTINGSEDGSEWTRSLKSRVKLNISGSITHLCSPQYTSCQLSYHHLCSCWLKERKLKIISSLCFMLFDLVFFFFF